MDEKIQYRNLCNSLYDIRNKISALNNDINNLEDKIINLLSINDEVLERETLDLISTCNKQVYYELNSVVISNVENKC